MKKKKKNLTSNDIGMSKKEIFKNNGKKTPDVILLNLKKRHIFGAI